MTTRTQDKIRAGSPLDLDVRLLTPYQFQPGFSHGWRIRMPNLIGLGQGPTVAKQTEMIEQITATANPDPGNAEGYTAPITISIAHPLA